MKTQDLLAQVAERTGFSVDDVSDVVLTAFAKIAEALADGESVKLLGLGRFSVRQRSSSRLVMRPGSGLKCAIVGPHVVHFSARNALTQEINQRQCEAVL